MVLNLSVDLDKSHDTISLRTKRDDGSLYTASKILSDKRGYEHFAGVVLLSRYFGAVDRYSKKPYLPQLDL